MSIKMFSQSLAVLAVLCFLHQVGAEDISAISCEPANGTACTDKDPKAKCKSGENKCSCVENYILNTDKSACIKNTAVGKQCTDKNADCTADANSECTNSTCSCKANYMAVNNMCEKSLGQDCSSDATICNVAKSECKENTCKCMNGYKEKMVMCEMVLDGTCSKASECNALTNTTCTGGKCVCATDYVKEDAVCKRQLGKSCTAAADCVANAECPDADKMCTCMDGYKASDDMSKCDTMNGAGITVLSVMLLTSSLLLATMNIV